jgi:two-component system response regulator YesN
LIEFDRYFTLLPSQTIQGIGNRNEVLTYVQSIPMDDLYGSPAVLVALIDSQKIRMMLDEISRGGYGWVLNENGEILLQTGTDPGTIPLTLKDNTGPEGILHQKREVVSFARSNSSGIQFISVVPRKIFMSKLNQIRNLMFWIIGIGFVIGLVAAYLMAYRNYRPIRIVVDTLTSAFDKKPVQNRNELEFIRETVLEAFKKNRQLESEYEDIIRENKRFREQINKNSALVKNGLLTRLIKNRIESYESALEWLSRYEVVFPFGYSQIILFHIDDCTRFLKENNEKEWSLVRFIIVSLTEQLSNAQYRAYTCELDYDLLAFLLNCPENVAVSDEVSKICNGIQVFMKTHYETEITVGIGNPVTDIHSIYASYNQALTALDYRIIREKSSVIRYGEITDRAKEYYYPIEAELSIINSVRAGDIMRCERVLNEIYEQNFQKNKLPVKLVRCLVFDMISTAIKVLDQVKINYVDVFDSDFDPVEELIDTENVHEIYKKIKSIYSQACQYLNSQRKSHNFLLKERILTYIHNHFSEMNLSQTLIADELGITAPYLSSFFKHEAGESMVDYINKLRIEQAKMLLAQGNMSLAEISHAVGCGSDKTLIRLFNRFEGVTPGRFRESSFLQKYLRQNA